VIPIGKSAHAVTVRTGLLTLLRKIADESGVSRTRVINEMRAVLANDQDLLAALSEDNSHLGDLR
jgi:hypothetical protein